MPTVYFKFKKFEVDMEEVGGNKITNKASLDKFFLGWIVTSKLIENKKNTRVKNQTIVTFGSASYTENDPFETFSERSNKNEDKEEEHYPHSINHSIEIPELEAPEDQKLEIEIQLVLYKYFTTNQLNFLFNLFDAPTTFSGVSKNIKSEYLAKTQKFLENLKTVNQIGEKIPVPGVQTSLEVLKLIPESFKLISSGREFFSRPTLLWDIFTIKFEVKKDNPTDKNIYFKYVMSTQQASIRKPTAENTQTPPTNTTSSLQPSTTLEHENSKDEQEQIDDNRGFTKLVINNQSSSTSPNDGTTTTTTTSATSKTTTKPNISTSTGNDEGSSSTSKINTQNNVTDAKIINDSKPKVLNFEWNQNNIQYRSRYLPMGKRVASTNMHFSLCVNEI
ncbi:engulfment and cell motility ELM family protein [Tieghemostelium lacteum]|uniref:Engulfment and cell motility ELM family protein n=1 Tax=Tieghemostelium lacteum TaxID=361077 RepID=A0A151ZI24_TIELA|nr:engulfment and cell motility ELM family protein [Tieghemostelium lacteum]|eukprot:KYQ93567.1 engulfment and cell motility ELM family protein [Tieghemostelium lacteum]